MAIRTEAAEKSFRSANRKLAFFNIIIVATAAACIFSMLFTTFWSFKMKITPDAAFIKNIVPEVPGSDALNYDELLKDIDLSIEIKISPSGFIKAVSAKDDTERVKAVLEPTTGQLSSQVKGIFTQAMKVAIRMARGLAVDQIKDAVAAASVTEVEAMNLLDGLEGVVGDIMESDGLHKDAAMDKVIAFMIGKIPIPDTDPDYADVKNAIEEQAKSSFGEMFGKLADSEGKINPETMIYNAIGSALGLGASFNPNDLIDSLSAKLAEQKAIVIAVWALIVFWGFPIVLWALLAVFALLRLLMKKKGVSMWYVKAFCMIPCILIFALPSLAFWLLPKAVPTLAKTLGAGEMGEALAGMVGMVKIGFNSPATIICAAGTILIILLTWFGYRRAKRTVKRNA